MNPINVGINGIEISMERDELKSIVENVLLAADQPVHVDELEKIFLNTVEKNDLQLILEELKEEIVTKN